MWKTASDFMKRELITVDPETKLEQLAELLDDEEIHGVPVVNRNGFPLGVVSMTDINRSLSEDPGASVRARDIMSDRLVTATENTSAGALAALMLKEKVHRVLITRDRELVGMVSSTDLLKLIVEQEKQSLRERV